MRISVLLLLCSLPLIAAQAARADGPSKAEQTRLFFGKDERIKVTDTAAQPWQAIGQVETASGNLCTATLIPAPGVDRRPLRPGAARATG